MNLYDQLQQLQRIPEARNQWAYYRQEVTDYILTHTYGNKALTIFGAGYCNDIDLVRLSHHFEHITLVDKEKQAMEKGIAQWGVNRDKVAIEVMEFTGINDKLYRSYAEILVAEVRKKKMATEKTVLVAIALNCLEDMEEKIKKEKLNLKPYCNGVVIGVHSQLLNMLAWIWQVILETLQYEEEKVRQKISYLNHLAVTKLNESLLEAVEGSLIMGFEVKRLGKEGSIQGAMQGMMDLKRRLQEESIHLEDKHKIVWPFNTEENKFYEMEFYTLYHK